jgi:hypothetical protein
MAINLWKLGGQPTSYFQLPISYVNFVTIKPFTDYVMKIKARSALSSPLSLGADFNVDLVVDGVSGIKNISLSQSLQIFTFTINTKRTQRLYLLDKNSIGDIFIDSVELVEKPLQKLTLNGIDGFLSGKWNLNSNAKVIDDEILELNATAGYQSSLLDLPFDGNVTYSISLTSIVGTQRIDVQCLNSVGAIIATHVLTVTLFNTFISPVGTTKLRINIGSGGIGKFTFKRPMLNLGSIPIPYEKKRGDRMVMPVPKGDGSYQVNKKPKHAIRTPKRVLSKKRLLESKR